MAEEFDNIFLENMMFYHTMSSSDALRYMTVDMPCVLYKFYWQDVVNHINVPICII